jgi:ATP-dependent helicase/nuclease subunit A
MLLAVDAPPTAPPPPDKPPGDIPANPALTAAINRRAGFSYGRLPLSDLPGKLAVTDLAGGSHGGSLYRPSFSRGGLSAAERGSAIHLFMQCADYGRAALSAAGELERLVSREFISREAADSIDVSKLELFFASELGQKAAGGETLREYAFIDAIDASEVKKGLPPDLAGQKVLLQGIADCVILEPDGAILVDYKSDRAVSAEQLAERYRSQLELYRAALNRRLPVKVKSSVIYSFELGRAIEL